MKREGRKFKAKKTACSIRPTTCNFVPAATAVHKVELHGNELEVVANDLLDRIDNINRWNTLVDQSEKDRELIMRWQKRLDYIRSVVGDEKMKHWFERRNEVLNGTSDNSIE